MSTRPSTELEQLKALHDIVLPAPPGVWPPAPAWGLVTLLVILLALRGVQHLWQHWRANAYRRRALRQLNVVRHDPTLTAQARATEALRILHQALRALAAQAATVNGKTVPDILRAFAPDPGPPCPDSLLAESPYWPPQRVGAEDAAQILDFVEDWLRRHRRPA
jgi:hypothetical protein